ncbi:MAG: helix-turn-helix transcriptional regulator [Spirochaetales bacterium]|jgi:hypothetical protein|nr:helix-turn-helix transcriptional regulator [Spirochaetales bacterium]
MKPPGKKLDPIYQLKASLPPRRIARAQAQADQEIFRIRLSELRKKTGVKQEDIKNFSQSSISRIESRRDMKLSTLIQYLDEIGMGIEITVFPRKRKGAEEKLLVRK